MIRIFVEGKEENFISFYLKKLFDEEKKVKIDILPAGGWNKLEELEPHFKETTDISGKNLVIFDADTKSNNGGFQNRQNEINQKKQALGIEFELFLFPNNTDDGDFELLLENCINQKHKAVLECFTGYEKCMKQYKKADGSGIYKLPQRKARIYSYVDAFPKSRKENEAFKNKGDWFFDNNDIWNFDNDYIKPLREFFTQHINISILAR